MVANLYKIHFDESRTWGLFNHSQQVCRLSQSWIVRFALRIREPILAYKEILSAQISYKKFIESAKSFILNFLS